MRPRVSVIVPLYNYERYIGDCIQSIKNQDFEDWELYVIDDCSTDGSFDAAEEAAGDDLRIHTRRLGTNGGYSRAKNEGIVCSRGAFITCLDADDMFTKTSLSARLGIFDQYPELAFVHGRAVDVGHAHTLERCYAIDPRKATRTTVRIHAQGVMLRRWVHEKYGLYDEELRSRSDKEMWWRLFGKYDSSDASKVDVVRKKTNHDVAYYRKHKASMMERRRRDSVYDNEVTRLLKTAYKMRRQEITPENTRMLGPLR